MARETIHYVEGYGDAAKVTGSHYNTIYNDRRTGRLAGVRKQGRKILIPVAALVNAGYEVDFAHPAIQEAMPGATSLPGRAQYFAGHTAAAESVGLAPRALSRLLNEGRVPGAYQPGGKGSKWFVPFDGLIVEGLPLRATGSEARGAIVFEYGPDSNPVPDFDTVMRAARRRRVLEAIRTGATKPVAATEPADEGTTPSADMKALAVDMANNLGQHALTFDTNPTTTAKPSFPDLHRIYSHEATPKKKFDPKRYGSDERAGELAEAEVALEVARDDIAARDRRLARHARVIAGMRKAAMHESDKYRADMLMHFVEQFEQEEG